MRSTREWNSFSKIKVKTLSLRTLEITFGKDTYPNRHGKRLPLRFTESLPLLEWGFCGNMKFCPFPGVLQPSRAEETRAGNRNNPLPPCTQPPPAARSRSCWGHLCSLKTNIRIYCHLTWADLATPIASTRRWARQALGICQPIWQLFFRKTCFSLCLNLGIRECSVPWIKASTVREAFFFSPPAPFVGISTVDLDWKRKTKANLWICSSFFFFILYLFPAPGRATAAESQRAEAVHPKEIWSCL